MGRRAKLLTAIRITENTSFWVTSDNGVPIAPDEIALTPGLYYISDDGTASDLCKHIQDALFTNGYVNNAGTRSRLSFSISSAGVVTISFWDAPTVREITINWTDAGAVGRSAEYVRDALRFSGTTTQWSDPAARSRTGSRCHLGGFYPTLYVQQDLETIEPIAEQFTPDNGNAQTLWVATRLRYRLRLRASGYPRPATSSYTEFHDLKSWYIDAASGRPFRFYPDTTVTTAYAEGSNWWGYQTMTLIPTEHEFTPEQDPWYKLWVMDLEAIQYT